MCRVRWRICKMKYGQVTVPFVPRCGQNHEKMKIERNKSF